MKILGMIGGTGPESTVEYYRRFIATYHARVSESGAPPIIINSVDNKNLVRWFTAGELARVIDFLSAEIERLARAGADFALIAAVTPHLGFDKLQQRASRFSIRRRSTSRPRSSGCCANEAFGEERRYCFAI